jgi:hypothetical protein
VILTKKKKKKKKCLQKKHFFRKKRKKKKKSNSNWRARETYHKRRSGKGDGTRDGRVGTIVKPVSASIQQNVLFYFLRVGFDNEMTSGVGGSPDSLHWVAAHAPSATAGPINLSLSLSLSLSVTTGLDPTTIFYHFFCPLTLLWTLQLLLWVTVRKYPTPIPPYNITYIFFFYFPLIFC